MNKIVISSVYFSFVTGFAALLALIISGDYESLFKVSVTLISILLALASLCFSGQSNNGHDHKIYREGSIHFLHGIMCTIPMIIVPGIAWLYEEQIQLFKYSDEIKFLIQAVCCYFLGSGIFNCSFGLKTLLSVKF
ncbi:hypothetical protein [Vibrio aestuarianus]|uniref:hypothetical protein n=1 Tax=Vibrio aestuarianus TaxID=28171 RepID=UPI00237CA382|nr:hypothetical protein [Vibrio aestuarianus]MDE1221783.1 hypothetical protein [Vibrio aestuarianus]MDE1251203.1 hypothetical protein [Vibrio aestuarianus]MDE1341238.1 hypothetical protein [Vibrio aestuarianus]